MNRKELLIIILIVINENLFYLINRPLAPLIAIFAILYMIKNFKKVLKNQYPFKKEILILILICFISEIGAAIQYGQPILYGLFGMHYIFIYFLYFYFVDYFNENNENAISNMKKIMINFGTIMSFLYLIQALIYPKFIIFHMSYGERGGHVRFYTGYVLILFAIIFTYAKLLRKFKIQTFGALCLQLGSLIIVTQTRNFILAIFIVLLCGLFIKKKNTKVIGIYFVLCFFILYGVFFSDNNNILNNLMSSLFIESQQSDGNVGVRIDEINFYLEVLKRNVFSGMGILYSRFELTNYITGFIPYHYFVGDIGMIGFIVQTGMLGAIWFIIFLISFYKNNEKILDEENSYIQKLTFILILGLSGTTGLIIDKGSILYLSLILAIGGNSLKDSKTIGNGGLKK